ncbi:uncharacterized protein LOC127575458 isoform X2 [Pristis pectinata]|uniref:uncharacterized protein LOC127575458 isoform X2 n=1 Tax=Pristis pectinata TaxID=685728 RepID=UPI00223E4569|nr:uncharacterized protein LOC127575458 isoform X2 [Pristis pectinata]
MFQNIRFPSSGKAEEGKRNQVLDYLGGIFSSGRKKTSKKSSAVPLSPGNSVEESPPATKDLSSSGQNSPSNVQDSGFSQDHRSEGLIETEVPDQCLAEISPGSPDESCPSAASSDLGQQTVSSPETKKATIIDISLQSTEREPEPKGVREQLSPEVVHSNPTKEVLSDVSSTLVNNLETSLSSGCTGAILPSIDRTVKECEIAKPNDTSFNENKSQDSQQQKDNKFVNSDRLTEGQYDCKIDDKCVDIPAIKEYILPISETVRIEQIARVAEIDIHVPKVEVNSSVKLSEASVSLPVNSIGVELKALEKPLKNEENKQLNHSTFQRVKKEIGNPTISEKTSFTPDLAKQQIPSKKDELTAGATKTKVEETGSSCITCIGEDTANLLKVERHSTDNLSGENLNGLVEQESNTDKPVTNSQTNVGHFKNTVEKLDFLDLKFDLNTATLVSFEMDKKSPSDGKRGGRKGRKRRSLKSDQSGQNTGIVDTNTIEETLKENDFDVNAVKLPQQSPEVPVKMLPSPKQGTSPLIHRKTLPKSVTFTEKSVESVSKPFASRKKSSQRGSFSPDNEIESPVKGSSEKTSNSEAQFGSSVSVISSHKSTPIPGQKVERNNCKSSEVAFVDSTNNEAFNVSLPGAIIDKLGENTIALDSANQNSDVESVSCISNQQSVGHFNVSHSVITQESGADSERLKTQKIKNSKGKGSNKNVITSQPHSTVTTRIRLPSSEKGDESDAQSNPSNQLEHCTEIRTEEEETIRITLPKKKSATSHHTVDFFTTKDLPLASNSNKTCVGSLKIQIQNKSARRTDGTLTVIGKRQPNTLKNVEAAAGVKVDTRPKTDEISKVKADDTKHISEEGHRNEGVKTASVHVENTSLKTFDDMDAGSSEASCSLETVSSALCEHNDMKSQSSSVDTQTSETCLTEIEKGITSKSTKRQEEHLDSAVVPLVPAVPSTGAELKSGEMEGKATLLPSVLLSENRKEALTNRVNGSKAIMAEENPGLGQQNTPKVENQDFAVKDTAMPQKVEAPTAVLSDKDKNESLDLNQRGRSSDVIVGTVISAQQSPPTSQSMEDVALSQGSQASKTMSEIEEKSTAKTANERPTDTGITVGKLVHRVHQCCKLVMASKELISVQRNV